MVACAFGSAADAHDAGLVVLEVAACVFGRAADAHDARLFVLRVAACVFGIAVGAGSGHMSLLMHVMMDLRCWEWRLLAKPLLPCFRYTGAHICGRFQEMNLSADKVLCSSFKA